MRRAGAPFWKTPLFPFAFAGLTGARGAIPKATLTAMRNSGLAHLLAISGLHVGLVAGLLFFGVRALLALVPALALRYPIKKWAAVAAGLGAFAYLALTGATVPTQRAYLMVGLVLLGVLLDRNALSFRLVAWAAVVVLAVAPESLLSPSFQLSFAAVAALIAAYEMLRDRFRRLFAGRGILAWAGLQFSGAAFSSVVAGGGRPSRLDGLGPRADAPWTRGRASRHRDRHAMAAVR